ncbi:telomere length regulation protein-like protein [Stemphylium lycopersici]|uniref:Telomere length regulation protein-like protein n=1 Tax=Stemphylium lycopersici TaxID=183478 RepID=A0A364MTB8_STELY|nr:telomere length regulation protein-like protein [Stemphylium lycopersici]
MTDFLTAVSTKKVNDAEPLIQEVKSLSVQEDAISIDSAESALGALKNQPSRKTVNNILSYLTTPGFSLLLPDPLNASIAHQLVNDTIPNYWKSLKGSKDIKQLEKILKNPTSLGHLITRLRSLIADSHQKKAPGEARNAAEHISDTFEVLDLILRGNDTSFLILQDVLSFGKNSIQKKLMWREYLAQAVSGRILSVAAEAEDVLKNSKDASRVPSWIADGNEYASWLGRNVAVLLDCRSESEDYLTAVAELCSKALGLGYTVIESGSIERFADFLSQMKTFEQRKYMNAIVAFVVKCFLSTHSTIKKDSPITSSTTIDAVAGLIHALIKDNDVLKEHLVSSLTRSTIPALDDSLAARRSILAALTKDDALAQTLALCSGYVKRSQPMFLTMMAKSTYHVNGMSNRIGAASTRARFLGIAVGIAISKMVDKPDLQLKFELEGAEAEEAGWYQRLTEVDDKVGTVSGLQGQKSSATPVKKVQPKPKPTPKPRKSPGITEIQGPRVVEVLSDSEDEDADLMMYEKPDSDPEDDTDDPTAINRNKPTTPVYIRDLIAGLRDQENYDRHELALATAASLIRRKANFGTEVADHLDELATLLTGLQDNSDLEAFAQQRQQALIALLLARPAQMAQWFARSFFSGDYSLQQRIAMLTTLGIGAREMAGMKDTSTDELIPAKPDFPSKQLPPRLHKIYAEQDTAPSMAKISSSMAREMLSPIASQAADQLSGPNVLKVRTFSSRMEVEKKRHKPIPNALAQIVADNFFFPLTGRWWLQVRANNDSIYASTHLLPPFLQTLSILLNASGPNTLALPQMTREYWDLLLSVRGLASNDKNILNALLFGFLMLLETNENKERLATEHGKELVETQAWTKMVFDGLGAGSEEDERVRVLAAGVVVRCQEVVEKIGLTIKDKAFDAGASALLSDIVANLQQDNGRCVASVGRVEGTNARKRDQYACKAAAPTSTECTPVKDASQQHPHPVKETVLPERRVSHHHLQSYLSSSTHCARQLCTKLAKTLSLDIDLEKDQPVSIIATLDMARSFSKAQGRRTFMLNFELGSKRECFFYLAETDPKKPSLLSSAPSKDNVETVQDWMEKCKCAEFWEQPGPKWYPRRLLDLQELRASPRDVQRARVRLVESKECIDQDEPHSLLHNDPAKHRNDRYVTLSHCWGKAKPGSVPLMTTFETEERFKNEGIMVQDLPKTFRDAVDFASRLERVGFIWIDSLCIRQAVRNLNVNEEEQQKDWIEQSRHMGKVYQKSFLNISATASSDSHGGLFFDHLPEHIWDNDVYIYCPKDKLSVSRDYDLAEQDEYIRCSLMDTSTWDDLVEHAPVNRRAWVLQERLLAPRVLHFGHDQLAWECQEFNVSESQIPDEIAIKPSRHAGFLKEGHFKSLTPSVGRSFREGRLNGFTEPDEHIKDLYIYELWKKTVENYSRTQLTKYEDRLIALGGMAKLFQEELFVEDRWQQYVAGLWSRYIESQLLWHVNIVYLGDGVYDDPSQRHPESGPSFSWASIDTPHGITYGDVTDYKTPQHGHIKPADQLFFKAVDHNITLTDLKNPFGMVKSGRILLAPRHLHPIELHKQPAGHGVPYMWRLTTGSQPKQSIEYTADYLDAPSSDTDIFGPNAQMYCMPAAYGERTVRRGERTLNCLLLKCEGSVSFKANANGKNEGHYRAFRRVGLAKVDDLFREELEALLEAVTREVICLC